MYLKLLWSKTDLVFMKQAEKLYARKKHLCLGPQAIQLNFFIFETIQHIIISQMWRKGSIRLRLGFKKKTPEISSLSWGLPNFYQCPAKPSITQISSQTCSTSPSFSLYLPLDYTFAFKPQVLGWNFLRTGMKKYTECAGLNLLCPALPLFSQCTGGP